MKKSFKKYIPRILIFIGIILLLWYILAWYFVKKEERLSKSYLTSTNTISYEVTEYNELSHILKEIPNEYFIYISYPNNEKIYRLEKKLKKVIDDYNLQDEFYYFNIKNIMDDTNINTTLDKLSKKFNTEIPNIPCILFYKEGKLEQIIVDNEDIFNYNDFINLLNDYNYQK